MSTLRKDFDRIALVSTDGATHNEHYHNFLLRYLTSDCRDALEVGCGTGGFARRLAGRVEHVLALDLSPEMIRLARERSANFPNIDFQLVDVCDWSFPVERFDCIASIATLHHLPYPEILSKMRSALKPGGVLLILDLFEPAGITDSLLNLLALPVSAGLRLMHHGRLLPRREVRDAWKAHEQHDSYLTMREVRSLCERIVPGAKVRKHLLWRYSIVWQSPESKVQGPKFIVKRLKRTSTLHRPWTLDFVHRSLMVFLCLWLYRFPDPGPLIWLVVLLCAPALQLPASAAAEASLGCLLALPLPAALPDCLLVRPELAVGL